MRKLTQEEFIEKANKIHNNKYNYSLSNYSMNKIPVTIICPEHGVFNQRPNNHMLGQGCYRCGKYITKKITTNEEFIKKAKKVHGEKYDYSKINYIRDKSKIEIICRLHGVFKQSPNNHLRGQDCPSCFPHNKKKTKEEFIQNAQKIHKNRYCYDDIEYQSRDKKVKIKCSTHGMFMQSPYAHLFGQGCPLCRESKGERRVRNFLETNNISYTPQKKFADCKSTQALPFDFYVSIYNLLIEYDGEQHFKSINLFGGKKEFNKRMENDKIKDIFAKNNGLKLLRISYKDFNNIEQILTNECKIK